MKDLQLFVFGDVEVRVSGTWEEPWFVAKDVCEVLSLSNPTEAVRHLDEDEKGLSTTETPGGAQQLVIVNESGLYALIFKSRKPQAKAFRKWVTNEVIPAIRKSGRYEVAPPEDPPASPPPLNAGERYLALPEPKGYNYVRLPQTIARFMERAGGFWHGTATDLWHQLNAFANPLDTQNRDWPCTPQQFGVYLNRCSRQLMMHNVEFNREKNKGKVTITLRYAGGNGHTPRLDPSKALPAGTIAPPEQSDLQAAIVQLVLENQALKKRIAQSIRSD